MIKKILNVMKAIVMVLFFLALYSVVFTMLNNLILVRVYNVPALTPFQTLGIFVMGAAALKVITFLAPGGTKE